VVVDNQTGVQVAECCDLDGYPISARERAQMIAGYFNTVYGADMADPGFTPPDRSVDGGNPTGSNLVDLPPDEEHVVRQLDSTTWAVVDLQIWRTVCVCTEDGYSPTAEQQARFIAASLNLLRRDPDLLGRVLMASLHEVQVYPVKSDAGKGKMKC